MSKPVACILGAASGIGRATAELLHARGYDLILSDLSADALAPLCCALSARAEPLDMSDRTAVGHLAASLPDLDALVVTAGLSPSMGSFARIIEINLTATAACVEMLGARLREGGAAVCISSMTAHTAPVDDPRIIALLDRPDHPRLAAELAEIVGAQAAMPGLGYALSKAAILRLVRRLAAPFGVSGHRICSVSPGCIDTPMGKLEMARSEASREALKVAPIPRSGTPQEVANAIAFLISPQAAYITGCDLQVDGGWVGSAISGGLESPLNQAVERARAKQ